MFITQKLKRLQKRRSNYLQFASCQRLHRIHCSERTAAIRAPNSEWIHTNAAAQQQNYSMKETWPKQYATESHDSTPRLGITSPTK